MLSDQFSHVKKEGAHSGILVNVRCKSLNQAAIPNFQQQPWDHWTRDKSHCLLNCQIEQPTKTVHKSIHVHLVNEDFV